MKSDSPKSNYLNSQTPKERKKHLKPITACDLDIPQKLKEWEKEWEEFEISLIKVIGALKSDNVIQDHLSRVQSVKSFISQLLNSHFKVIN